MTLFTSISNKQCLLISAILNHDLRKI